MAAVFAPVMGVLGSCVGCMMVVEHLATEEPGCMNLMTFSTFVFIALEGLIFTNRFFTVPNKIPITGYFKLVAIFFTVNVVNNQALNFHVPVPLHIIFRSGSLLASMVLGVLLMKRSYTTKKYISVFAITVGIIICTLATGSKGKNAADDGLSDEHRLFWWTIVLTRQAAMYTGITMLTFALIASAYLGITQERLFSKYGKHPREALLFVHLLSLPGFALMYNDISKHAIKFNDSAPVSLLGVDVPSMWLWLLLSDVTQYFSNPFTPLHWMGTALVFAGTLLFTDWSAMWAATQKTTEKKTQ